MYIFGMFASKKHAGGRGSFYRITITLGILICLSSETMPQSNTYHPDGRLGRLAGQLEISHTSISSEPGTTTSDVTGIKTNLIYPYSKMLVINGFYNFEYGDSIYHTIAINIRLFAANPVNTLGRCNPDGKIGVPVISLGGAVKIPDPDPGNTEYRISSDILLPISTRLSFGIGINYYDKDTPQYIDDYYGIINFFPAGYPVGLEYKNPDGVEGIPSFSFRAGGSSGGMFGQLRIVVPLQSYLSIGILLRGEKLDFRKTTKASLATQISYFPDK